MKKTKSLNNLMISTSNSERGGKFQNIMNSPNFGKQQIILQSCCFFDYDKCQTPKANISNKSKINSGKITEGNKNIISKNKSNMDLIREKFDEMRKNEVDKLRNENKVLKDTINNLILQLDKTFKIAENVKNKEKNISQINTYKENEIINMKDKINSLIYEKQQLLDQIRTQRKNFVNRTNSFTTLQSPTFRHKRNISFTDYGYNKIKDKNICFTESNNNETENNQKYFDKINYEENTKLNGENIINNENTNKAEKNIVLYEKRLNKRKYIFNKKNTHREYPIIRSRNITEINEIKKNNNNTFKERHEDLFKKKSEKKFQFKGLLSDCDKSGIKYNTQEINFINDNSLINAYSNINNNNPHTKQENKIKNLEKINYELKLQLQNVEKKEKIKFDLLMNKYNQLYSESIQVKTEYDKQIKSKDTLINEINNKYNNIVKEFNDKNSVLNNLKAKYDQLTRINKNNINLMNNNRLKMNEAIMENNELKNELRKKEDEIAQKNIEIGRFKKIVNDLKELKNMEIKLKQNDSSNDFNNNDINSQNLNINSLLKEIEEYKSQINKLTKEKEELQKESEMKYIHEGNNTNNDNDKILLKEYLNKISKLEEKNKKLEKLLTKSNQELDQYEIESKEADIEIKSFKMKISELMEEIKKLKHKETIEEVIEENYEEEEDKKENN